MIKKYLNLALLILTFGAVSAQEQYIDTLRLAISKADSIFVTHNLSLLAAKYNVDATKALIIQAKLYPNTNFSWANNLYNNTTHKWFPLTFSDAKSDNYFQVDQVILLAGKIKKQVKIAETNYKLAEDNLLDLLRTLKLALHISFYNIYYLQNTAKVYNEEIKALKTIVAAYSKEKEKGFISEADNVLIQAQLYSLQNEYQNLIDNINDLQSQARLLLRISVNTYIQPLANPDIVKLNPFLYSLKSLLDSAYVNRTDFMIARDNLQLSQHTYAYQKSLAVPDITLGMSFTQSSNYVPNDLSYSIGFPLPIFNRNQGNIRNAGILIDYNKTQLLATRKALEEQIWRGLQKAVDADKLFRGIEPSFAGNFETLANEMLKNYIKRNVGIINFLTFYDAYKQNIVQLNTISFNKINALENLNFLTGTNFYNK